MVDVYVGREEVQRVEELEAGGGLNAATPHTRFDIPGRNSSIDARLWSLSCLEYYCSDEGETLLTSDSLVRTMSFPLSPPPLLAPAHSKPDEQTREIG